jgi:hypothetical protein
MLGDVKMPHTYFTTVYQFTTIYTSITCFFSTVTAKMAVWVSTTKLCFRDLVCFRDVHPRIPRVPVKIIVILITNLQGGPPPQFT